VNLTTKNAPRILLYDLETSPNIVYTWGVYEQDAIKVIRRRQIISFAWKWLGEKEVKVCGLPDFKTYKRDRTNNRELIRKLHGLFNEADVTVAHNVKRFDDKRAFTDMVRLGFAPTQPHRQIDTLEFARMKFDFNSNKLDDLGAELGLGRKVKHPGFEMWEGCLNGDPASWALMKKYNVQDVVLLERVYLKLRPWMKNHPVMTLTDRSVFACPVCGGTRLQARGWRVSNAGRRRQYQCQACGKWSAASVVRGVLKMR